MTNEQILEQVKTHPITEVAKEAGLKPSEVYALFKKHNPGKRLSRSRFTRERMFATWGKGISRVNKMRELREQGMSFDAIGKMQTPPISRQRVHQLLK